MRPLSIPLAATGSATVETLVAAHSVSRPVLSLLDASEPISGRAVGAGYVDFDGYVLALTPPTAPRMPDGIACDVRVQRGDRVLIGAGAVQVGSQSVTAGPVWDPVPRVRVRLNCDLRIGLDFANLAGRGPGLTPYGDDLLAGYVAGRVLWGLDDLPAVAIAETAARRTTSLSATLLRHAARGELPEPAHKLLECGDPAPLINFGHSSGCGLMLGLAIACPVPAETGHRVDVSLPRDLVSAGVMPETATVWVESCPGPRGAHARL